MKNLKFGMFALLIGMFASCDSHDDCHECHIAYIVDNVEVAEVEIGEFCGSALEEVEGPDYTHELTEDVTVQGLDGNDVTVPAGVYNEIHCEDHGHDDHDH